MHHLVWDDGVQLERQLAQWSDLAATPGLLHVAFDGLPVPEHLGWGSLEPWTRTRAVTIADVRSPLASAALECALCCDLVYFRTGSEIVVDNTMVGPGLLWAAGRAGGGALARVLLDRQAVSADEAVALGLAHALLDVDEALPVGGDISVTAMTAARDLVRAEPRARPALELASFRLLFAVGDPGEGARSFFERRRPTFVSGVRMEQG